MIDGQQAWYKTEIILKGQIIVDVGANTGALSKFFWQSSGQKVISVEPLVANTKLIGKKIKKNKAKNWYLETCAVSNYCGDIEIASFHSAEHGWNSMVGSTQVDVLDSVTVPCKTLAAIAPDANVIKMDIEGHEYVVLDQALATMPHVHTWAIELHMLPGRPLEVVLAQLADKGFQLIAAGRQPNSSAWLSIPVNNELTWSHIPVAKQSNDGRTFKMLHIIAKK